MLGYPEGSYNIIPPFTNPVVVTFSSVSQVCVHVNLVTEICRALATPSNQFCNVCWQRMVAMP